jgi:type II secretory pathway component PulJ
VKRPSKPTADPARKQAVVYAEVDVLTLMNLGAWASLNSARRYARASRKRLEQADRKRAEAALTVDHREMVAADLEATEPANVLTLKKKTA